jgi:uncharacterized protein YodC (DUF2158 family)
MTVLKSGDLVVLKSGGPVMTVDTVNTDIFDDNKVTGIFCAWFVGDKLERARFDQAALVPAAPHGSALEKAEAALQEITGEYRTVLDDMLDALNDAADAAKVSGTATNEAAAEKPERTALAKSG